MIALIYHAETLLFVKVEEVLLLINTISDNVKKVKAKHGEILADPNTDTSKYADCELSILSTPQLKNH